MMDINVASLLEQSLSKEQTVAHIDSTICKSTLAILESSNARKMNCARNLMEPLLKLLLCMYWFANHLSREQKFSLLPMLRERQHLMMCWKLKK